MKSAALLLGLFGMLAIFSLPISSAQAQERTWVSGTGNDLAQCSRTAPCKTFQAAYEKTAPNGEINCLDSDGFGPVFINKPITIDCAGTFGRINGAQISGSILVGGPPNSKVVLRNLIINGFGTGYTGVIFNGGGSLDIENVTFEGLIDAGILSQRQSTGVLTVKNSSFSEMPTGIKLNTTTGNIVASVSNTSFNNLSRNGVEAGTNTFAGVYSSTFTALNGTAILAATASSTVYAENNVIQNTWFGISAAVAGARINANGNGLYGNSKAFNVAPGAIFRSATNNKIDQNVGDPSNGGLASR
jgi:hypothetical protein